MQRSMEKSILRINRRDKIRAIVIRRKIQCTRVTYMTEKLEMGYAGYLARMPKEHWCTRIEFWVLYKYGKAVGRPSGS